MIFFKILPITTTKILIFILLSILIAIGISEYVYSLGCDKVNGYPRDIAYQHALEVINYRHPSVKFDLVKEKLTEDANRFFAFKNGDNQIILYIDECGASDLVGDEISKKDVIEELFKGL